MKQFPRSLLSIRPKVCCSEPGSTWILTCQRVNGASPFTARAMKSASERQSAWVSSVGGIGKPTVVTLQRCFRCFQALEGVMLPAALALISVDPLARPFEKELCVFWTLTLGGFKYRRNIEHLMKNFNKNMCSYFDGSVLARKPRGRHSRSRKLSGDFSGRASNSPSSDGGLDQDGPWPHWSSQAGTFEDWTRHLKQIRNHTKYTIHINYEYIAMNTEIIWIYYYVV